MNDETLVQDPAPSFRELARQEAVRVLEGMITQIQEHGWCRGNLMNRKGNFCFVGARNVVQYGTPYPLYSVTKEGPAHDAAVRSQLRTAMEGALTPRQWERLSEKSKGRLCKGGAYRPTMMIVNDDLIRDRRDAVAFLRRAIRFLEGKAR